MSAGHAPVTDVHIYISPLEQPVIILEVHSGASFFLLTLAVREARVVHTHFIYKAVKAP